MSKKTQSRTLLETSTDFPLAGILLLVGIVQEGGLALESGNIVLKTLDWWAQSCGLCSLFNKHKVFKNHKIETKKIKNVEKSVLYVKISGSSVCLLVALYKILFLLESVGGYSERYGLQTVQETLTVCPVYLWKVHIVWCKPICLQNASSGYFPWVKQR